MIVHYLKIAFRNLWKYKVPNLIGILGLAIGLAIFAITVYLIRFVWETDSQHPGSERMYIISTGLYSRIEGNFEETMAQFPEIEKSTSSFYPFDQKMTIDQEGKENIYTVRLTESTNSFLDFFSFSLLSGNKEMVLTTPNSIALWESRAKRFGTPETLVGKEVLINNGSYTITGILKDVKGNSNVIHRADGVIFNKQTENVLSNSRWGYANHYLMLRENTSPDAFREKLANHDFGLENDRVVAEQIHEKFSDPEALIIVGIIFLIALLVLLTALFNYISFQSAQFYNRLRECAIRKVNGAGAVQQLFLFYTEVAVVFILAALGGLLFIEAIIPYFESSIYAEMLGEEIMREAQQDVIRWSVLFLLISFLLSIIPTRRINSLSSRTVLLGLNDKGRKNRSRNVFLFVQMVVLAIFVSSTLIIKMQENSVKQKMWNTLSEREKKEIITFSYNKSELPNLFEPILSQLNSNPNIESVTYANYQLSNYGTLFSFEMDNGVSIPAGNYPVADNFIDFFHVKMVEGSFFNEQSSPDDIVIDETLANLCFPDSDPLGASLNGKTIVGIIQNIQAVKEESGNVTQNLNAVYYTQADPNAFNIEFYVKAIPGKAKEVSEYINTLMRQYIPETLNIYVSDFHEEINGVFMTENFLGFLSTVFFIFSLVLCLLSIFSAVMMSTEKRRKEVAIRKVNGATVKDIILLFAKSYFILWTLACVVVFPFAYLLGNQWVSTFTTRMPLGLPFFLVIYGIGLVFILLTVLSQIYRTVRENPADVIKSE